MTYFTYNGRSSADFGLHIEKKDVFSAPEYDAEFISMQYSFGKAAYLTITELWNAEVAAKRFLQLSQALLNGTDASGLFANGPCSLAKPLREDWYQR